MTPKELIEWLDNEIETEMQKPTEEIDMEYVNECEQLIDILMDNYHEYTDEDAEKYFAELEKKKNAKKTNVLIRSKKILAASIAILIIFLGGFTIYASSPVVKDIINKVLGLNVGQSLENENITYTNNGKTLIYGSIEDLVESEDLSIVYPVKISYNASIELISYTESDNSITFAFDDKRIQFIIKKNTVLDESRLKNAEKVLIKNYTFFLVSKDSIYLAYSIINNDFYSLQCDSKEELLNMINSFK